MTQLSQTFYSGAVLALAVALWIPGAALHAQDSAPAKVPLSDLPAPPPPPVGLQPEDLEPDVNIVQRNNETVEEYRVRGQLYMMKVTPAHGKPYYLIDPNGDGNMVRYSVEGKRPAVPMWILLRW